MIVAAIAILYVLLPVVVRMLTTLRGSRQKPKKLSVIQASEVKPRRGNASLGRIKPRRGVVSLGRGEAPATVVEVYRVP